MRWCEAMTLSNAELTFMRECINDLLPDTCTILSNSGTTDSMGGFTNSWGTASASVSCRLDRQNGSYQDVNGGIHSVTKMIMTMPYNTTITTAHRIVHSGNTYNVTSVLSGSWIASKRAEVELL